MFFFNLCAENSVRVLIVGFSTNGYRHLMKSGRAACRPIDWTLIFGSANAAVIRERRLPHTSVLVRTAEPSRPLISVYAS